MPLKLATALFCAAALGVAQTSNPTTTTVPATVPAQAETQPAKPAPDATNSPALKVPDSAPSQADAKPTETKKAAAKKGKKGAADDDEKPITDVKLARKTYVIGPLDVLQIKVWRNADLTNLYDVRPDGMISMPLVGEVKADGLTVEELKAELNRRITEAGQKTPDVDVQVPKINSKKFYVTGGVKKTGEFPLPEPITVLDALMNTGGFTDFANKKKIFILRGTHKYLFNYNDVVNGKRPDQNIVVMPNDKIVIPE